MCDSQAHDDGATGSDRFSFQVVPILVLPGVAGTRLRFSAWPHWDIDSTADMLGLAAMPLRPRANHIRTSQSATITRDLSSEADKAIPNDPDLQELAARWLAQQGRGNPYTPGAAAAVVYKERGWGELGWGWYGPILTHLEKALNLPTKPQIRYPVYGVGYDWRKSNFKSAQLLHQRIGEIKRENPNATHVIVVSHSMGGLVTRAAMRQFGHAEVMGIVHTVMPSAGAPQHYRRFHTGWRYGLDSTGADVHGKLVDLVFGRILGGSNGAAYGLMMSQLKGPMELLPTPKYPSGCIFWSENGVLRSNKDVGDGIWVEYLKDADTPAGIVPVNLAAAQDGLYLPPWMYVPITTEYITPQDRALLRDRIRDSKDFYEQMFASETPHPNTYVVYATGIKTDVQFDWNRPANPIESRVVQLNTGDG
ncbi:MAG TPA: hypothetical protein VMU34_10695, partial [Mycobacterium sp.]|nr:hypothetical protein [Mycobacterium sp.]